MSRLPERDVFIKTIYAEARGEPRQGQEWVAWVIKNRARMNKSYWGGRSIKGVCLHDGQFECWNGQSDIKINEQDKYDEIAGWVDAILDAHSSEDPTGGADHYNNPRKEGYPSWTDNCVVVRVIGNHTFYKSK